MAQPQARKGLPRLVRAHLTTDVRGAVLGRSRAVADASVGMTGDGGRRREKQKSSNPLKFLVSLFLSFSVQPRCGGSIRRISDAPDHDRV